ncbi:hypothetical protein [Leucobacter chromiiresistens]|uniref:hypothetical protein n=1 Tax=Leucobacter chromiiresistens TaxID=1079994 RepID=UPI000A7CB47C|nr:hypothetical protein [Leucobacter chromiiresistens]
MRRGAAAEALALWRGRRAAAGGGADRRYATYLGAMLMLVCVAPAARALWLAGSDPEVVQALTGAAAPRIAGICAAAVWIGALLVGRVRGPALRPPTLASVLARSAHSRAAAFGGAVVRSGWSLVAVTAAAGACFGALLVRHAVPGTGLAGLDSMGAELLAALTGAAGGAGVGACAGAIAAIAWLAGQAAPRAAGPIAAGIAILVGVTEALPEIARVTPWGWIADAWAAAARLATAPDAGPGWTTPGAALAAFALALLPAAPALLARLETAVLEGQAARWESSAVHAFGMDFSSALAGYVPRPSALRRVRAVRDRAGGAAAAGLVRVFLVRDAVGAARAPARLVGGAIGVAVAGPLVALASVAPAPGAAIGVLGAGGAVLAFAALGPFTDGLRHAAAIAADLPLYGVDDAHLLLLHSAFPLSAVLVLMGAAALTFSVVAGVGPLAPVLGAAAIGVAALIARANAALKGPMPLRLLASIPTPAGDLSGAVRLLWAVDGVLLVALAGAIAPLALHAPAWGFVAVAPIGLLVAIGIGRWRGRRA